MTYTRPDLSFANTRASRLSTTANIPRHEKSEAQTKVPTRHAGLQVHPTFTSDDNTRKQQGSQQQCQQEQQFTSDRKRIRTVLPYTDGAREEEDKKRAQEALHIRNFLMETILTNKLQTHIHTDSTSTKRVATRIRPMCQNNRS